MHTYNVANNLSHVLLGLLCTTFLPVHGTGLPNPLPASQTTPAHGATATVLPQEGVRLFAKLRNINLYAMEHPKTLQGIVAKQDILRVKKALQSIFFKQKILPTCMIQASCIKPRRTETQHTVYALYDILAYIYGSANKFIHNKKRFSTYQEAYQAGIMPVHLTCLDHAIRTAENICGPYVLSPSFQKAFALLTGNMYGDVMNLSFACHDVSYKLTTDHVQRLSLVLEWLDVQSHRTLPKELHHLTLCYAYGKSFEGYHRIHAMEDVLFSLSSQPVGWMLAGNTCSLRKFIDRSYAVSLVREGLQSCLFPAWVCPVAFPERICLALTLDDASDVCERYWYVPLYSVLSHIRSTPYLDLLQQGWTEDHVCLMEQAWQSYVPYIGVEALETYGFFCLLGAFATSKALKCIHTTSCQ